MSDRNYYQPHVYLAGKPLAERGSIDSMTAVADLTISWGGADWWENIEPSQLDLRLLDPYGTLIGKAEQQPIEIRRDPDNAIVFTGHVDEVVSTYTRFTDPRTGQPRDMWVHDVRAYCPLAALKRDRRRGVTYDSRDIDPYRLHWGPCTLGERKTAINSRSPVPIEWPGSELDQFDEYGDNSPLTIWPVSAYERQQVVSLLTVLRNTARIFHPLNRVFYAHSTGRIEFIAAGKDSRASGLRPSVLLSPVRVALRPFQSTLETLIPGGEVSMESGVSTSSALREQMTHIEITTSEARTVYENGTASHKEIKQWSHSRIGAFNYATQMTLQVDIDASAVYYTSYLDSRFSDDVQNGMRYTYGSASFEPLEYRFAKHEPAPDYALDWLTPEPPLEAQGKPRIYHLINSLTNWIPSARPFSIVGGELKYTDRDGWIARLNTAPSRKRERTFNYRPNPIRLEEITWPMEISTVSDDSIVADWQQLAYSS